MVAPQQKMRLERLKPALALSAPAELLRLALSLHRLLASDAALAVKAGMAPARAEGLTRIRNRRRQFRAAARVAAVMAKRLGHCRTNFGRCRVRDRPVISSGTMLLLAEVGFRHLSCRPTVYHIIRNTDQLFTIG